MPYAFLVFLPIRLKTFLSYRSGHSHSSDFTPRPRVSASLISLDRCVRSRMGCTARAFSLELREVVSLRPPVSHQCARAPCCSPAVTSFDLRHLSLLLFTDNETIRYTLAVCRIRSLPLCRELVSLLSEFQRRDLFFQVLRVPTALNVVADAMSRAEPLNTE